MSGRSSEVPVQEREGQEIGRKGKEREQPQTLDMTRVQAGDKRTRDERSPTGSLSSPDVVAPPSKQKYNQTEDGRAKKAAAQREHAAKGTGAFSEEARAKNAAAQRENARLGIGAFSEEAKAKNAAAQREKARLGIGAFSEEARAKSKESKERKYAPTKADINRASGVTNKYAWMNQSSDGGSGSGTQS